MRQRYYSPQNLVQSQQYAMNIVNKPKRLRFNGSMNELILNNDIYMESTLKQNTRNVIGNSYIIDYKKQLGSGYSSKVYKAYSISDINQQYAIKVLNIQKFTASSLQMLQAQIRILKSMHHLNILKIYDVFKDQSYTYIVTQYCQYGDLQTYMTRKGKIQEKQALKIITEIYEGMKYLMKNNIIHRDLKPANILLGKNYCWKIADFGFAIQSPQQITTRHNVGTPLYMPPESLIKNFYSSQSDIFALGIILYQMIVGSTPWQCSSQKELIRRLTTLPFKIPSKIKINPQTVHLLQKMCQVSIAQRMTKQEFLNLNLNNFSSLDILNLSYSKKRISKGVSKKIIQDPKSRSKTKSKKKGLIRVTSKQAILKSTKQTHNSKSKMKSRKTSDQKRGFNEYMIASIKSSEKYPRKVSVDSSTHSIKKSKSKCITSQKNLQYYQDEQTILSTASNRQINEYKATGKKPNKKDGIKGPDVDIQQNQDSQFIALNVRVMLNQLEYCRFIYYLMKNLIFLQMPELNKQKIGLVLFKHLIKLIKMLSDKKFNHFNLLNFQQFMKTKKYENVIKILKDYENRYDKQYLHYVKYLQISVLRQINQKLPQLSTNNIQTLSIVIYQKIIDLLKPILKQINEQIDKKLIRPQIGGLTKKIKPQIECLNGLIKYYKLIQFSINYFQNYTYFEENSDIQFLKDYSQSAITLQIYYQIKDQIKNL